MEEKYLLLAVIQETDQAQAVQALNLAGLPVTLIGSHGSFLEIGNSTLLMGLARYEVGEAMRELAATCRTRSAFVNAAMAIPAAGAPPVLEPVQVQVGGATLFLLPVDKFVRLPADDRKGEPVRTGGDQRKMKLVVAIIPDEQVRRTLDTLKGHYQATLISTTGGFLRKGSGTLLIGVESESVDPVLEQIAGVCREASASDRGQASATIFVLDVEQHWKL